MRAILSSIRRWGGLGLLASLALGACDRHHVLPQCSAVLQGDVGSDWVLATDGTARHRDTGLTWYRCNAGERFVNGVCAGAAVRISHAEALRYAEDFSSASGRRWRLPALTEMRELRLEECNNPAVDIRVFPSARADHYWSAQTGPRGFGLACSTYMYNGMSQCRDDPLQARYFWLVLDP